MKEATTPNWYVGRFDTPKGPIYRVLRVRVLGKLESLFNGLAKTVIEHSLVKGWKKVRPSDYTEVGGPFSTRMKARNIQWKLGGKKRINTR